MCLFYSHLSSLEFFMYGKNLFFCQPNEKESCNNKKYFSIEFFHLNLAFFYLQQIKLYS